MPCIKQKEKLMEKIIEVKNLFYEYPKTNENENTIALQGVDFSIERGEFVGIIGHNGSGKSTLSKLLNAIIQPTDGDVIVNGMNTKDPEHLWDIRQTAGMVFQNPDNQLVATIVEEDVAFGPKTWASRRRKSAGVWTRHSAPSPWKPTAGRSPTSCPAARSSGSPLPAYWPWNPTASFLMSLPPCSTHPAEKKSCGPSKTERRKRK